MTSRRKVLADIGSSILLQGCATFVKPMTAFCSSDPRITDPDLPLAIDMHAHVFNGTDLQVKAFFGRVRETVNSSTKRLAKFSRGLIGVTLLRQKWSFLKLRKISGMIADCEPSAIFEEYQSDGQSQYTKGQSELENALNRVLARKRALSVSQELQRQIRSLPKYYSDFKTQKAIAGRLSPEAITARGAVEFIIRNFQYRYVTVFDYLYEYSTNPRRKIDLLVAHLVDYDWPIADGDRTLSTLHQQIEVMKQISVLTGGRVHCFAPFDPMKQVAHKLGHVDMSPLTFSPGCQYKKSGFIGAKMYPPMGFAPYGNWALDPQLWDKEWIPDVLRRPDLGTLLAIRELLTLYTWCRAGKRSDHGPHRPF